MSGTINYGGSAFPCGPTAVFSIGGDDCSSPGMSMRDYFAAKALPVVLQQMDKEEPFIWLHEDSDSGWSHCSLAARYAYAMADEMLRVRGEK